MKNNALHDATPHRIAQTATTRTCPWAKENDDLPHARPAGQRAGGV